MRSSTLPATARRRPGLRRASSSALSDEALLGAMAEHNELAVVEFVRRFQRRVFGLAYGMLRDASSAEEVAQEAMVRAWRHAAVYDPRRASVSTWLLTITRNLTIDALRVRRPIPLETDELLGLLGGVAIAGDGTDEIDMTSMMRLALGELPVEQRRALVLAAVYGFTAQEVSEHESIPLGTAKSRIRLGLVKLRGAVQAIEEPR